MASHIAVSTTQDDVWLLVGQTRGNDVHWTAAVHRGVPENETPADVLRSIVDQHSLGGRSASLVIQRRDVEIRNLDLPPAPDEDLPDIVRLQAIRSFAAAGERSTIDYVPMGRRDDGVTVLAAASDAKTVASVCSVAVAAGLQVERVSLQPLAAASLYRSIAATHRGEDGAPAELHDASVVSRIDGQIELAVVRGGKLSSIRTVRLPVEDPGPAIASEIRRSRLAAGCTANCPVLVLTAADDSLAGQIEQEGLRVLAADPLDGSIPIDGEGSPSDFAALAGLIHSRVDGADDWQVNFVSPKKRPEVKPNRLRQGLIAAAAALVVMVGGVLGYKSLADKDRRIAEVQRQIEAAGPAVDDAVAAQSEVETIEQFLAADVPWLDEVRRLAVAAPGSDELIVTGLSGTANVSGGGGKIDIKGRATSPGVLSQMASSIGGRGRRVIGDGATQLGEKDEYRWGFTQSLRIDSGAGGDDTEGNPESGSVGGGVDDTVAGNNQETRS